MVDSPSRVLKTPRVGLGLTTAAFVALASAGTAVLVSHGTEQLQPPSPRTPSPSTASPLRAPVVVDHAPGSVLALAPRRLVTPPAFFAPLPQPPVQHVFAPPQDPPVAAPPVAPPADAPPPAVTPPVEPPVVTPPVEPPPVVPPVLRPAVKHLGWSADRGRDALRRTAVQHARPERTAVKPEHHTSERAAPEQGKAEHQKPAPGDANHAQPGQRDHEQDGSRSKHEG